MPLKDRTWTCWKEDENKKKLESYKRAKTRLEKLRKAWLECEEEFSNIYADCNDYICDDYPFHRSFDEIDVDLWATTSIEKLNRLIYFLQERRNK